MKTIDSFKEWIVKNYDALYPSVNLFHQPTTIAKMWWFGKMIEYISEIWEPESCPPSMQIKRTEKPLQRML